MNTISDLDGGRNAVASINPSDIFSYCDAIQIWLKHPLPRKDLTWLRSKCGSIHVHDQPARFDWSYQQRLQLRQPTHAALQSLSTLNELYLNRVELSLDWTFANEPERDAAYQLVCLHHVKKWHGQQHIGFKKLTRYTGPPGARNLMALYPDKACRITGEVFCVHLDWRIKGPGAVRAAGVSSLHDLLDFNYRQFWEGKLLLCEFDVRSLGRHYNSHVAGKGRRRGPWIYFCGHDGWFAYDVDLRTGAIIIEALQSTQQVIDCYRGKFNVNRCLKSIEVQHLLPSSHYYDEYGNLEIAASNPHPHNQKNHILDAQNRI